MQSCLAGSCSEQTHPKWVDEGGFPLLGLSWARLCSPAGIVVRALALC